MEGANESTELRRHPCNHNCLRRLLETKMNVKEARSGSSQNGLLKSVAFSQVPLCKVY